MGDQKQSIYGFRGARVELFEKLREDFKRQGKFLTLKDNFRSEKEIIDFVNQSFDGLMTDYEPIVHHRCINTPNLHFITPEGSGLVKERREYEGELIARKIRDMMADEDIKVYDKELKKYRRPSFRDFSVLLRKKTHLTCYIKALEAYKIPFYVADSSGLTESAGVKALINALEAIEFRDDISLYGTLSGIFGVEDHILAQYVLTQGQLASGLEGENTWCGSKRLEECFKIIQAWAMMKDRFTLHELASKIIVHTKLFALVQERDSLGVENLFRFLDLCTEYDEMGYTLRDFLLELGDFGEDYQEAIDTLEDEDVVKFITIHSSKGLEFPIVILADCAQDISISSSDILFDPELGMALKQDKAKWDEIKQSLLQKEHEEAKRILYVALTRARDHLIVSGEIKKSKKGSFLNWLMPQIESLRQKMPPKVFKKIEDLTRIEPERPEIVSDPRQIKKFLDNPYTACGFYSVTLLGDFLRCPKRYYFGRVMGIPERTFFGENMQHSGLSAAERGSIVHQIIEKICSCNLEEKESEKLVKAVTGRSFVEEDMHHIKRCLNTYFESELYCARGTVYPELPFTYRLKDRCYVTGIIDYLRIDSGEAEIVDFKTNVKIDQALLKTYTLQVQAYALAIRETLKIHIKRAAIASLFEGELIDVDISSEALNTCRIQLEDIIS